MSRNAFFQLWKKNSLFDVDIVVKNKNVKIEICWSWSVLLSTTSARHYSFPKRFIIHVVFERKVWRIQAVICIVQRVHFEVRVGDFNNCQQILAKIFFVIFDIVIKKQIECVLAWHWWNSTDLGLINWHVFKQSECRNCCLYIIIQRITPQAKYGKYFQIWFPPDLGGKWRRSEHALASYPGL